MGVLSWLGFGSGGKAKADEADKATKEKEAAEYLSEVRFNFGDNPNRRSGCVADGLPVVTDDKSKGL
jgi:hypothetical protein